MTGINLLAPNPGAQFQTSNGNYVADGNALISGVVPGAQLRDLIEMGCIPLAANPFANFRNILDGGDATTNPFQRNCVGLATSNQNTTAVTSTPTYFADRWFMVGGASSAILSGPIANTLVPGFSQWHSLQRKAANTNTAPIYFGQIVEYLDVIRLQGQTLTLSFWAMSGANYSGGALSVKVFTGTGTNDTAANMIAGSWAGTATPLNTTQAINAEPTRYQLTLTIPTNATALGVLIGYTPSGTAGAADLVQMNGFQLEIGASASPFEFRDAQVELEICQRYAWLVAEPAAGVIIATGTTLGANAQTYYMAAPVQFFKAPTVTVVTGGFQVGVAAAFGASTISAGTTHTVNAISVTSAKTATAGVGALVAGGAVASGGYILASSDF